MAGPIATETADEVVGRLESKVLKVEQARPAEVAPVPGQTWQTSPAPGSPPTQVTATNIAKPGTWAWWFEKGGTTGIICGLVIALFGWLMNAQREGQNAIISQMRDAEKNRTAEATRVIDGVIRTQDKLAEEINKLAHAIEKLEAIKKDN